METAVEHDVIAVDEFDALAIEVKGSPTSEPAKYPAKLHARKVASELNVRDGLVYLPGEPSRTYEDSDMGPEFRQRRYFYYLSGANFADCSVTYEIEKDRLILWIPYVEPRQVLWFGSTPGIVECLKRFDVDDVRYTSQLEKFFSRHITPDTHVYILHDIQLPFLGQDGRASAWVDSKSLQPAMDQARVVKTDYEVAMIRKANDVSSAAHRRIAERLLSLGNEREIEAMFRASCTNNGAKIQAYPVIAGSGVHASTLHYEDNDQPLKGKQLLVLDAGAEWNCYASDITRTLPISGKFSTEAKAIYDIVARMQKECIDFIRPGILYYVLHLHAAMVAQDGLVRLGILKGIPAELWTAGTIGAFFPHGLGHHVGLETHDVTGNERLLLNEGLGMEGGKRELVSPTMLTAMAKSAQAAAPPPYKGRQYLKKNMIVTVEPGIYFCREYIEGYFLNDEKHAKYIDKDVLEQYYDVGGVRIEDDILVTEDGFENLTTAPKGQELLDVINGIL